jgi:diaminopimelate epimerase
MIKFKKYHGTGNDYLYINALNKTIQRPDKLSVKMSDRHYGAGSDGLILIMKSKTADFRMRMFNPDGSEAEMCGNGIRGVGKYLYDHGITDKKDLDIETLAGIIKLNLHVKGSKVSSVMVDMGQPVLLRERIPMIGDPGMVIDETLPLDDGTKFTITSVSMGNPHVIIFVEDVEDFPVEKYGPLIENHDLFPQRTNVEFVQIVDKQNVIQRTWERGTGETLSCGTGAAAVTVASVLSEKTSRKLHVKLRGGELNIEWNEKNDHIYLTGPTVEIFEGSWPE